MKVRGLPRRPCAAGQTLPVSRLQAAPGFGRSQQRRSMLCKTLVREPANLAKERGLAEGERLTAPERGPMLALQKRQSSDTESAEGRESALTLCKAWYFLAGSSGVFFYPYLNVFLSQQGMSSSQIGLLSALRPWMAAPVAMASTALADKYKIHKQLLVASFVVSTVMRASVSSGWSVPMLFSLLLAAELSGAAVNVIGDATVLSNCQTDGDFGKQRLWGSLGFGAFSLLAGWVMTQYGFETSFALFGLLSIPMAAIGLHLRYNYQQQQLLLPPIAAEGSQGLSTAPAAQGSSSSMKQSKAVANSSGSRREGEADMRQVLLRPEVMLFLWRAVLMGFGLGVMSTYEFVYLKDLGAPETLMGVALLISCCTEVPAFQLQGQLMERVPLPRVLHAVLLAIALRLGCYAALPAAGNVWAVLPVELLHGLTFATAFGAGTVYANQLAPPGRSASMQGIFQATYLSVGGGLGGLLGGVLLQAHGGQALFRVSSLLVLGGWAAALVVEQALEQAGRLKLVQGAKERKLV